MKKRLTSILLILALVITMMPAAAMTAYGAINISAQNYDGIKWQIKEGVLHISKGTATDQCAAGEMGDAEMYGYKAWATYKDEITKVVIEEGVTRLGFEAFAEMPLLQSVEIGDSVETIGEYTFYNCPALKEIEIPASVKSIGKQAFLGCTGITKVTMHEGLESIGMEAFYNCTSLTDIAFPASVKNVGTDVLTNTAFLNAQIEKGSTFLICGSTLLGTTRTDFYAVDGYPCLIPDDIVCIAEKAFYDIEITELVLPASLKYIGNRAFAGGMRNDTQCIMRDTEIDFKNVEYIGNYAFEYAHYLQNPDLSKVKYLGDGAFYWCNHMKTVKLADEMEYLGSAPFGESDSITAITGPKFVKHAYYNSFYTGGSFSSSITDVNGDGYTVYNGILLSAVPGVNTNEIMIPDGVTTIAHRALDNYTSATVIRVPESVKGIAFSYNLHNITDVYYAGDKNGWNAIYMEDTTLNGTPSLFANATIHCAKVSAVSLDTCNVKLAYASTTFDGSAKTPKVTVTNPDGVVLTEGTHYTVTYSNNTKAGTAKVTVLGVGDYMGTVEKEFTIRKVSGDTLSYSLEYEKVTVDNKEKTPAVTVKDAAGKALVRDTDYTVTYDTGRKGLGKYAVEITMKGNYSGGKTLYFYILPMATSTVKTSLGTTSTGYDDVTVKWDIATGANGYYLYYKKASASKWTKVDCGTKRTYTKKNLSDGVKYQFKVVAYVKDGTKKIESLKSKTSTIYTLKKLNKPTVKKYSSKKVKASWTGINGESGYQVYKMKKVGKAYVKVKSYTTTKTYITASATKGKTYYYKVRAYKKNGSKTTYGPWSDLRSYKLPK